jgi:hypothetical protein
MSCDYEINEEETLILIAIKEHVEQMIKDAPLTNEQMETLGGLTEIQKLTKLLHYCLREESYAKNKHLYHNFLNLCVKYFQKDICEIMKLMEIEPSDELTKQLQYAINVYSNIIFLKKTLNF